MNGKITITNEELRNVFNEIRREWMDAAREKDMPETAKIVSVMVSLTKNKVAEKLFKESEV